MQGLAACASSHHTGCEGPAEQDMGPWCFCQTLSHHTGSGSSSMSLFTFQPAGAVLCLMSAISRLQQQSRCWICFLWASAGTGCK